MTARSARAAGRGARLAALLVVGLLAGCAWLPRWAKPSPAPISPPAVAPAPPVDVRPAAEAWIACPNHAAAAEASAFPRAAIIRGVDNGYATVRFQVEGDRVTIVSIASSDPDFGMEAAAIVGRYACRTDRPVVFEVPFDWRTRR